MLIVALTDDFQASSKELEEELERELASTESVQADLRAKIVRLESEKEEWKVRTSFASVATALTSSSRLTTSFFHS